MNREVHVRFCERFRGEIPLYLLDYLVINVMRRVTITAQKEDNNYPIVKAMKNYTQKKI